jgi:hypothetical protein
MDGLYRLLSSVARRRIVAHFFEGRLVSIPDYETLMLPLLEAIVDGAETKEIASRLQLSSKTVEEAHRGHIMRKLKVKSVAQLVGLVVFTTSFVDRDDQLSSGGPKETRI